jgi:hypothetical protein
VSVVVVATARADGARREEDAEKHASLGGNVEAYGQGVAAAPSSTSVSTS